MNMGNIISLNSIELERHICQLGDFVKRYVNGQFEEEYYVGNWCNYDHLDNSKVFPDDGEYNQVAIGENTITIIMDNGCIFEYVKSKRCYYTEEEILKIADELFNGKELMLEEYRIRNGKKEKEVYPISYDEVIKLIKNAFYCGISRAGRRDFIVNLEEGDSLSIEFFVNRKEQNAICLYNRIFVQSLTKRKVTYNKIIQSNKFRSHMQVHEKDFIIPYQNVIQYASYKGYFNDINDRFIDMVVEFPFNIGYSLLCETTAQDTIVYAKRKNREIYSRFTLDGKKKLTNKCVFVLNRSNQKPDEYYFITMFPGEYLVKEPQDKNIKDELERQRMLEFWRNHALVFNPKDVDLETATYSCPYDLGA